MAQEKEQQIRVRNVWASNLIVECDHIKTNLGRYSFASIKCKYPLHCSKNFVHKNFRSKAPELAYDFMRLHIGNLPIIQLGFTLFNLKEELPVIEGHPTIWVFHFNMSDSNYSPKYLSEAYLKRLDLHGLNLEVNKEDGIDPVIFRDIIIESGIIWGEPKVKAWVSFMGIDDFGYLVKILMENNLLPETFEGFLEKTKLFFGVVYNARKMAEVLGFNTSFEEVRDVVRVHPVAESEEGNAGFESHFIMQVIMELKTRCIRKMEYFAGKF